MLVGYMRVSSDGERQTTDLQRDALLGAGVDERHLFEDHASGSRDDRPGLAKALAFLRSGDCLVVCTAVRHAACLRNSAHDEVASCGGGAGELGRPVFYAGAS
jgi:hypothetical protein